MHVREFFKVLYMCYNMTSKIIYYAMITLIVMDEISPINHIALETLGLEGHQGWIMWGWLRWWRPHHRVCFIFRFRNLFILMIFS